MTIDTIVKLNEAESNIVQSSAIRLLSNNEFVGTYAIFLEPDYFSKLFTNIDMGKQANVFILNSDGIIISSNSNYSIGQKFNDNDLTLEIFSNTENNFVKEISEYIVYASKIQDTNWCIVSLVPKNYLYGESKKIGENIIFTLFIIFVLSMVVSVSITKSISEPLKKLVNVMKEAREGNLNVSIEDNGKDEISEVMKNFNHMISNMNDLIRHVTVSADEIKGMSNEINNISNKFNTVAHEFAHIINEIATGASEQAVKENENVIYMGNLSQELNDMGSDMENIYSFVNNTKKLVEEAMGFTRELGKKSDLSETAWQDVINKTDTLYQNMTRMYKIVSTIVDIANKTKLISINVSIEAARASKEGKGFSVLAEQIRKLSERSKTESNSTKLIIRELQESIEDIKNITGYANDIFKAQLEVIRNTESSYITVFQTMDEIISKIGNMQSSICKILTMKKQVLESIEYIASISQETAATTQEVSASINSFVEEIGQLLRHSSSMDDLSVKLNKSVQLIKLK